MTALESSVSIFKELAGVPELALCYITSSNDSLIINAPIEFVTAALWQNRGTLKKAAIDCGFTGSIHIKYEGERYGPRISLSD